MLEWSGISYRTLEAKVLFRKGEILWIKHI